MLCIVVQTFSAILAAAAIPGTIDWRPRECISVDPFSCAYIGLLVQYLILGSAMALHLRSIHLWGSTLVPIMIGFKFAAIRLPVQVRCDGHRKESTSMKVAFFPVRGIA